MGKIFYPTYTLDPTICLHTMCDKVDGFYMGYGFWIPEKDFNEMNLGEIIFPYYTEKAKKKGESLKWVIKNIELYPTPLDLNLE